MLESRRSSRKAPYVSIPRRSLEISDPIVIAADHAIISVVTPDHIACKTFQVGNDIGPRRLRPLADWISDFVIVTQ